MNRQAYSNATFFIAGLDRRYKVNKKVGWVYIAHAQELGADVFKIGMTSRPPPMRTRELARSLEGADRFRPLYFVHVLDRFAAELWVHRTLDEHRVRSWEEYFRVPLGTAIQTLDEAAEQYRVPFGLPGKLQNRGEGEFLPQVFEHWTQQCPSCGEANRIWDVVIPVVFRCKRCQEVLHKGAGGML